MAESLTLSVLAIAAPDLPSTMNVVIALWRGVSSAHKACQSAELVCFRLDEALARDRVEEPDRPFHTPMETPTVRRVRARGLQARTSAPVGRVPSRGVWVCGISGPGVDRARCRRCRWGVLSRGTGCHGEGWTGGV